MTRLERWIDGDRNRKFVALDEAGTIVIAEETVVPIGPIGPLGTYRKDKLVLTREEAEWLVWALGSLLRT